MNVGVCLKSTPGTDARIIINPDANGIDTSGVRWIISPFDEFALEAGAQTKEALGGELIVLSIGGQTKNIREALAKGGDRAVRVEDPALDSTDALGIARALAAVIKAQEIELAFCGKVAIDEQSAQVPAMVAEILGWPHISVVTEFSCDGSTITATRAVGGGIVEVVTCQTPAVITTERGLNSPRYAKLPQIAKAKRKQLDDVSLSDIGLSADDVSPHISLSNFTPPAERASGHMISGEPAEAAKELIRLLREDAKVI
jgi:electron transfer flavoprotein beta subunit